MTRPTIVYTFDDGRLTYSAPCTACGEDGHGREACPYGVPVVESFEERANPAAIGWRFTTAYPDGARSQWELVAEPDTGRIVAAGRCGDDGRWITTPWRGHRPPTLAAARAYAWAFAHGADLPPEAGRCGCRECEAAG